MKNFNKYLLTLVALCSFTGMFAMQFSPEDTAFVFDFDDVVVKKEALYKAKIALFGVQLNPFATRDYIKGLIGIKKRYAKDSKLFNKSDSTLFYNGEPINGLTFDFLYHGMQDPLILPYAAGLVKKIEQSRELIPSTIKTIRYLKEKGYPIIIATNKDRFSFDYAAQHHGPALTDLIDKVIVTDKNSNSAQFIEAISQFALLSTPPESYKQMYADIMSAQPTQTILHAPSKKPESAYYQYLCDATKDYKNLFFTDDNKENINGFNNMNITNGQSLHGIQFKKKNPLYFVDQLVERGVLSEKDDAVFLQDLRYSHLSMLSKLKFNISLVLSSLQQRLYPA